MDIAEKLSKIKADTWHSSSPKEWIEHPQFVELVNEGIPVLEFLKKNWHECNWIYLSLILKITNEKFFPDHAAGLFELQRAYGYIFLWTYLKQREGA